MSPTTTPQIASGWLDSLLQRIFALGLIVLSVWVLVIVGFSLFAASSSPAEAKSTQLSLATTANRAGAEKLRGLLRRDRILTLTGPHGTWRIHMKPSGRQTATSASGRRISGKWRFSGGRLCTVWRVLLISQKRCYTVAMRGTRLFLYRPAVGLSATGRLIR